VIKIRYPGILQDHIGKSDETIEALSVADVLKFIKRTYGKKIYTLLSSMVIAVNGSDIRLFKGLKTQLGNGDVVSFFFFFLGG
jgi:molybdopterin converting factor small subunit